jgi:D-galactarolactone cycloisomerase
MLIEDIRAIPISFPVPPAQSVRLGIGRSIKRDAVLVRVMTDPVPGFRTVLLQRSPA